MDSDEIKNPEGYGIALRIVRISKMLLKNPLPASYAVVFLIGARSRNYFGGDYTT